MTSRGRTRTWIGMAPGEAREKDEETGNKVLASTRRVGEIDGWAAGMAKFENKTRPEPLTRAIDLTGVRMERIVRLRLAIASGRYRVPAAELADKMVACFRAACG